MTYDRIPLFNGVHPVTPTNKTVYRIKDKVLNLYSIRFFIGTRQDTSQYFEGTATVLAFNPEQAMAETRTKVKQEYSYLMKGKDITLFLQNLPIAVGCNITSLEAKKGLM